MAVLVGIDEAGFGPILGPLVVSSSVFEVPGGLLGANLWQILVNSVSDKRKRLAGRLLIADSKKSYSRAAGIGHLERTVLACLSCLGQKPSTAGELLEFLCSDDCCGRLNNYPWYKEAGGRSLSGNGADIKIASGVFGNELARNSMQLLRLQSECLDVGHYNQMVTAVKNKARVLFTATARLIKAAYDDFGCDDMQVLIDRQGGRIRYRNNLQRMFGDMELTIITQTPNLSSYELKDGKKRMRLHFVVGADRRFLGVALASMTSKYLRELLVDNINRYFTGFAADLKPTAGYWKDGLRFIDDLKKNIPHVLFDSNQLIRCR